MKMEFIVEQFVETVRKEIRVGQVYEWYQAQLVLALTAAMDTAGLTQEQRRAVFEFAGIKAEDIPEILAGGYHANREAYATLHVDQDDMPRSVRDHDDF